MARAVRGRQKRRVRRFLPALTPRDRAVVDALARSAIASWNAEGWAIVGESPHLRLTVLVNTMQATPPNPISTIALPARLGGYDLKVSVTSMHRHASGASVRTTGPKLPAGAGTDYLAPGSPISANNHRVGIGAVIDIDGVVHIVTCGHEPATTIESLDQDTVGTLRDNYFQSADPLDAAIYTVTDAGQGLLDEGSVASTWCDSFHEPNALDNGTEAEFWPTWTDTQPAFVEKVSSYSSNLPSSVGSGYVMLRLCTVPGDSGSTLQLDDRYYALASQRDGNFSFFTPLSAIKRRIEASGAKVTTWSPG